MKSLLGPLLATALGAVLVPLTATIPSYAAPEDYAPTTDIVATDPTGDASEPGGDVTHVALHLDPTYRELRGKVLLASSSKRKTYVVVGLGTGSAETCTPSVEVVAATHSTFALVRQAGDSELPTDFGASGVTDLTVLLFHQPLLDGLVPQCATTTVVDRSGTVLDTATTLVETTPVQEGSFTDFDPLPPLVQAPAEVSIGIGRSATARLYDVHQDVTGDGITGDHLHRDYEDLFAPGEPGAFGGNSYVDATPGLHTVTITLTSGNAQPVSTTFLVWGEGGPALQAGGTLAGRAFLATSDFYDPRGPSSRTWIARFFLDDHWSWRAVHHVDGSGAVGAGVPKRCAATVPGCVRYAYDPESGQVEIAGRRGVLGEDDLYFDNLLYPDRLVLPEAGRRLEFRGRMYFEDNHVTEKLALHRDGTFSTLIAGERRHGRYRIGERGRLVLVHADGARRLTTIAFLANAAGHAQPGRLGVWALGIRFQPR